MISILRVKSGVNLNPGDPNYDIFQLAVRCSAKRLFPNFAFLDAPFNAAVYKEGDRRTEIAYMGCRTRVANNVYDRSKEFTHRRGNLSFTSINLPRLGIEANHDIDKFFELLDHYTKLAIEQLYDRMKYQGRFKVKNFPFLMGQGIWLDSEKLGPDDTLEEVIKHGTLSVGYIGLAECLVALIGEHHGQSDKAQELGLKIIGRMKELCDEEAKKTNLNYGVISTPELAGTYGKLAA